MRDGYLLERHDPLSLAPRLSPLSLTGGDRRHYRKCRRLIAVALDLEDDSVFVAAILCRSPEATRIQSNLSLPKMNPRAGCRSCAERSEALLPGQVRGADVNSMCSERPHSAGRSPAFADAENIEQAR